MDRYENLTKAMCKELEKLDKKYGGETGEMSPQDLDTADKIYHALKSAETYFAMKEESEGEYSGEGGNSMRRGRSYRRSYGGSYEGGMSGARGRSPYTGRFVSRDGGSYYSMGPSMESFDPYWEGRY